jgi:uncharacterized protein (TIGR03435 family)
MTQLEGEYRIELQWNPQNPADEEPLGTSIFQAVEDQLGLKLEAGHEAIELLVIDKASKVPTGN